MSSMLVKSGQENGQLVFEGVENGYTMDEKSLLSLTNVQTLH